MTAHNIVVHETERNSSDDLRCYPPDYHYCSDVFH